MKVPELSQRLGSSLMFRNSLYRSLVVPSWQRRLTLILSLMVIMVAWSELEVCLQVPLNLGRRGAISNIVLYMLQPSIHHHHLHLCADWYTSKFHRSMGIITSDRFVLNMVKGHHLQLSCCHLLFHNFRWFEHKGCSVSTSHYSEGGGWAVSQGCHWTIHWCGWLLLQYICCF